MKNRIIAVLFISVIASGKIKAQEAGGINFEKGVGWDNLKAKAKAENKYIFVDCFATWCGPCKEMDETIYPLREVGRAYNEKYISLKLQMDKTDKDNDLVRSWYNTARQFEKNYMINIFPTFLFFDPSGKLLHKVVGANNATEFIQLASDARDPEKQYYNVIRNFQPGKMDTSELKGLARLFLNSDTALAGKIALDYLNRIPKSQLGLSDNGKFMFQFRYYPEILSIAMDFIKSLNKNEFSGSLQFILAFSDNPLVHRSAMHYINSLSKVEIYHKDNIVFLSEFTHRITDRGFDLFYKNGEKIDSIMGDENFSRGIVEKVIADSDDLIQSRYWPELIRRAMAVIKKTMSEKGEDLMFVNNTIYNNIYLHSRIKEQLDSGIEWMQFLLDQKLSAYDQVCFIDTYACLLYKTGKKDDAIEWEQKILPFAVEAKAPKSVIDAYNRKIDAMKKDEQIWLEKEYQ